MAGDLWNRVRIPFPSALSSVRVHFSARTDENVKGLLVKNEKVLRLIRNEILQTEVRVLYELLYILNNSSRGIKTFKCLKQVEQCVSRLKNMKLDVALQDLTELCPNRIQRGLSIKSGECDVPSQPMLEWLCLKVLGAAQLMSCTLGRCSRAFIHSQQQMKWEEFIILNMVICSMLSRFWVIFRGLLVSLSSLYQQLLELLREVSEAQPMPFLTDFSLPEDIAQFLGPSGAFLLTKQPTHIPRAKGLEGEQQRRKKNPSVEVKMQRRMVKEDLGVAVVRDIVLNPDMNFRKVFGDFTEENPQDTHKADGKHKFKKRVREATTFTEMVTHIEEMIQWCKQQRMEKERRLLTFLRLKCQRMKCLEAAGYNVQRKLRTFRQEARWASSPQGPVPRTCRSPAALRRNVRRRTRFHSLRSQLKSSAVKRRVKQKRPERPKKRAEVSPCVRTKETDQRNGTTREETSRGPDHDDIDDIFASVGL